MARSGRQPQGRCAPRRGPWAGPCSASEQWVRHGGRQTGQGRCGMLQARARRGQRRPSRTYRPPPSLNLKGRAHSGLAIRAEGSDALAGHDGGRRGARARAARACRHTERPGRHVGQRAGRPARRHRRAQRPRLDHGRPRPAVLRQRVRGRRRGEAAFETEPRRPGIRHIAPGLPTPSDRQDRSGPRIGRAPPRLRGRGRQGRPPGATGRGSLDRRRPVQQGWGKRPPWAGSRSGATTRGTTRSPAGAGRRRRRTPARCPVARPRTGSRASPAGASREGSALPFAHCGSGKHPRRARPGRAI